MAPKELKITFKKEKETKNTVVFRNVDDKEEGVRAEDIRVLYLQKTCFASLDSPESLEVAVKATV